MSERDDTNLELVGRRIRGLLNKTTENGATEAEAMSAAAKARELMDKCRLTMTDVEVQEEPVEFSVITDRPTAVRLAAVDYCLSGIARYCGVKMWFTKEDGIRMVAILGLRGDMEMAKYLYRLLAATIKNESRSLKGPYKSSFQVGMATRVNERLIQMAKDLEPTAKTASGTALVVVKGALVNDAFKALNLHFTKVRGGPRAVDRASYDAGKAAGDRVNLNRPVGSAGPNKLLR